VEILCLWWRYYLHFYRIPPPFFFDFEFDLSLVEMVEVVEVFFG
jgi:hypothetical protein